MKYVIVRTDVMGVFAGDLCEKQSTETKIVIKNARRIWYWSGAASLSELAVEGTCDPNNCKFPIEVEEVILTSPRGFEILKCTKKAMESIKAVPIWTAKK